ncbi:MAG: sigma factor-like helix-turn-helix DNA-binding protein, partial [Candidatus Zixiibacteriota bacterium]
GQFRPSSRIGLFKIMVSAYSKQYRPFPTLSVAINSVGASRADMISTQSANAQSTSRGDHDSIGDQFLSPNGERQSNRVTQANQSPSQQFGDGVKRATTLTFNDAINNAFEIDGTWEQSDQTEASGTPEDCVYGSKANSDYEIETNGSLRDSEPAGPLENFNFDTISGAGVKTAIRALPDDIRLIAVLSLLEDFSYSEIADIVGVHLETVRSRIPQGRRLIRESIQTCGLSATLHDDRRQSQE